MDPLGELIIRIHRQAATDGPRTRAQSRATAPESAAVSPQASDRTATAVRALLAEGAPERALQLLTSDGVCDAADPAVLTRLRELHPQAEGPNLEPPLPEDRPDVAPSWVAVGVGVAPAKGRGQKGHLEGGGGGGGGMGNPQITRDALRQSSVRITVPPRMSQRTSE